MWLKSLWRLGRHWWAHPLHLLAPGFELSFLFTRQHADHLRHHSGVRDFQFDLDPCARFRGGPDRGFIEFAVHQFTLVFAQRSHLLEQRPVTFPKTLANLLDRGSLLIGQVQIPAERSEWPKAFTWWAAGPSRSSRSETFARASGSARAAKAKTIGRRTSRSAQSPKTARRRSRRRTLWLLRKHNSRSGQQYRRANGAHADLVQMKFQVFSP
jgi:hypothetical protein